MRFAPLQAALCALLLTACVDADPAGPGPDPIDDASLAPLYLAPEGRGVGGRYIVVYKEGHEPGTNPRVFGAATVYGGAIEGFAGPLSDAELEALRRDPGVAYVEQDQRAELFGTQVLPVGLTQWGLDQIDQHSHALNRRYRYESSGRGVTAYVIDTGVQASHPGFLDSLGVTSRAVGVFDVMGGAADDCMGHGTHVAGTIGSRLYGVAKDVQIRALRVAYDCAGNMLYSDVIAAINWVYANGVSPAVVNMSLGGGWSKASHQALDALVASGTFVVVAAGNSGDGSSGNGYSCSVSLAGSLSAYAVGAVDSTLARAYVPGFWGSNWGRCVALYAPGRDILSTMIGTSTAVYQGTSMASPHVAGAVARYLEERPAATSTQIRNFLNNNATEDAITSLDPGTVQYGSPNRLLFVAPTL
jgi:subtilisin family serine protease